MDIFDEQLIDELRNNGYQKISDLAIRLGKNKRTVQRRFNILKNKGVIRVIAVPNPKLTEFSAWANIGIVVRAGTVSDIARKLASHPSIYFVTYCIGTFNFMIAVHFETVQELTNFVDTELMKIEGVARTETWLIARHRKYYHFSWPSPFQNEVSNADGSTSNISEKKVQNLDKLDWSILNILVADGLARPKKIKSILGVGEITIRKRIKAMMKEDIFRIEVIPNLAILKDRIWATIGITTTDNRCAHRVMDLAIKEPNIHAAASTFGKYDSVMAGAFPDVGSLHAFVNGVLSSIDGVINIEVYILANPLKYYKVN